MKALSIFFLFLTISHFITAQVRSLEPNQTLGKGTIEDFCWMVGYWTGPGLVGVGEEV